MPNYLLKRAYEAPASSDGARVLVDRLWPRGIKKEVLDAAWLRDAAPSPELRKAWHAAPEEEWEAFAGLYRSELKAADAAGAGALAEALGELRSLAEAGTVTLVFAAKDLERNHAAVLREHLLSH
ncbi:DUF488 domain-containing protein [Galactobacter valiniphilus]|uniref:DUF488 domain-containing protein n=1 Tax=Galactobacter valiniphilus TaxID=2676122 RepID=UPI0037369888